MSNYFIQKLLNTEYIILKLIRQFWKKEKGILENKFFG